MADFTLFLPKLDRHEGGFQINPKDSGNYNSRHELVGTNWGISAITYEGFLKRPPTIADMKAMPKSAAIQITKTKYWDAWGADWITNQSIAEFLVDWYFNSGTDGIRIPQRVMGLKADGVVGRDTINILNKYSSATLFSLLQSEREKFLKGIAIKNPEKSVFLNSWLKRNASFAFSYIEDKKYYVAGAFIGLGLLTLFTVNYIHKKRVEESAQH